MTKTKEEQARRNLVEYQKDKQNIMLDKIKAKKHELLDEIIKLEEIEKRFT